MDRTAETTIGEPVLSTKTRILQSSAVNWTANYFTPRDIGRYLGRAAMGAAIEGFWSYQRRTADLTPIVADHFVRSGSKVIDVGASWGLFTYHLGRRVGPEGLIYSYEPHPANAIVLQKLANARPNVFFRPVAVSDSVGRAGMLVPRHNNRLITAQSSLSRGFEGITDVQVERVEVSTVTLDDEIGEAQEIDFVKIDVEGYEMPVLRGGASMLRRCLPTLLIEIEQRHLSFPIEKVFQELRDLEYYLFYIDRSTLRPISEFDVQRDQLSKLEKNKFSSFSMPKGYVCNFCAVRNPELLHGLPIVARAGTPV
jgi:FkbM family methyltransferase